MFTKLLLMMAGGIAGFIDSIAGGGGLITVPTLALFLGSVPTLGSAPQTIGTNKIPGSVAAIVALIIYWRRGHFSWQRSLPAAFLVWTGSLMGSFLSPLLPPSSFRALLLLTCPLMLYLIWRRDLWVREHPHIGQSWQKFLTWPVVLACLGAGIYDGAWGPGGGTLMFLALFFVGKLPLLEAVAGSKLMNTGSALVSLLSYGVRGYV